MKKFAGACMMILLTAAISAAAIDQEQLKVKGTVTSIDKAAATITVKPATGDAVIVVFENSEQFSKVKEGEKAEAKFYVKNGKNMGYKLRKIIEGCQ